MKNKKLHTLLAVTTMLAATSAHAGSPFAKGEIALLAKPSEIQNLKIDSLGVPEHAMARAGDALGKALSVGDIEIVKYLPHSGVTVIKVNSGKAQGILNKFRDAGFEGDMNLTATAHAAPSDPLYGRQWNFDLVQAESAWDQSRGQGVVVAVLDSGLDAEGEDGVNLCSITPLDVVDGDNDVSDGMPSSHGTHVAGTIAQTTTFSSGLLGAQGQGVAGLAPEACVLPVRVLDTNNAGSLADIAEGIYYAVDSGADVINMSLGTDARSGVTSNRVTDKAIRYAADRGVTLVASSGNNSYGGNVGYPAINNHVIAVGAINAVEQRSTYSNYGTGIELMAPGGQAGRDDDADGHPDGVLQETHREGHGYGYYYYTGTSMAAPHVSAAAALLIANGASAADVRSLLRSTAKDIDIAGVDNRTGYGLIQVSDALMQWDPQQGGEPNDEADPITSPVTDLLGNGNKENANGKGKGLLKLEHPGKGLGLTKK